MTTGQQHKKRAKRKRTRFEFLYVTEEKWSALADEHGLRSASDDVVRDRENYGQLFPDEKLSSISDLNRSSLELVCRLKTYKPLLSDNPKKELRMLREFASAGKKLCELHKTLNGQSDKFNECFEQHLFRHFPDLDDDSSTVLDGWIYNIRNCSFIADEAARLLKVANKRSVRKPQQRVLIEALLTFWVREVGGKLRRNNDPTQIKPHARIKTKAARFLVSVFEDILDMQLSIDQAEHAVREYSESYFRG